MEGIAARQEDVFMAALINTTFVTRFEGVTEVTRTDRSILAEVDGLP